MTLRVDKNRCFEIQVRALKKQDNIFARNGVSQNGTLPFKSRRDTEGVGSQTDRPSEAKRKRERKSTPFNALAKRLSKMREDASDG